MSSKTGEFSFYLIAAHVIKAFEGIARPKEVFEDLPRVMEGVLAEVSPPSSPTSAHSSHAAVQSVLSIFVIQISLLLVAQNFIGLSYLLELLLCTS